MSSIQLSSSESFGKRLERISSGRCQSAVDEMLAQGIPIHVGGMADPLPPLERDLKITLEHLKTCKEFRVPTIISTKSCLVTEEPWLNAIAAPNFVIQISIPTIDDDLGRAVDTGAPLPSQRLRAIRTLSQAGIKVSCRVQPALPGRDSDVIEVIHAASDAGAHQVAIEHLKLPIELSWPHRAALDSALNMNLREHYAFVGAKRAGREWILPVEMRLPAIIRYREIAKGLGLYFGAADSDLLHFSDGNVCCSGADLLGLGNGFTFNFLTAVRSRSRNGNIGIGAIENRWRPSKSIRQVLNSRSRGLGGTIEEYIRANWNGRPNGCSPEAFFGVKRTTRQDRNGYNIYSLSQQVSDLI